MFRFNNPSSTNRGFIALLSTVIISVLLLAAVISLGTRGVMGRYLLLDLENKKKSEGLASACVQSAIIGIAVDPTHEDANNTVAVGKSECLIVSVLANTPSAGKTTIETQGIVSGATTNLRVVVDSATADIESLKEVGAF